MPSLDSAQLPSWMLQVLPVAFLAISFIQSGLDKVFDWKGNMGWLTGHFSKSPLARLVAPMLLTLTVMELAAGALCAVGGVQLVATGSPRLACWGAMVSGVTFLALFFGQRMAKDYAGAAALVPYFLVSLAAIFATRG
jgi:uncharacterized membrane protein YphA (DoxX/SURF4 family)